MGIKKTDDELQKLWDDNVCKIANDLEDAMLQVFSLHKESEKPAIMLGSISVAAAHFIQVMEKQFGYSIDMKTPFEDVLMQAYTFFREHPTDDEDLAGCPHIKTPFPS